MKTKEIKIKNPTNTNNPKSAVQDDLKRIRYLMIKLMKLVIGFLNNNKLK